MATHRPILVVEDDPSVLRLTRSLLEHSGYTTEGASRGDQALALLGREAFDLVCLDLMLPTVSGFEICAFIRATPHLRQVPVLIISARALPLDRADALDAGANGFLAKPFTRRQLLTAVEELLEPGPQRTAASGGAP